MPCLPPAMQAKRKTVVTEQTLGGEGAGEEGGEAGSVSSLLASEGFTDENRSWLKPSRNQAKKKKLIQQGGSDGSSDVDMSEYNCSAYMASRIHACMCRFGGCG